MERNNAERAIEAALDREAVQQWHERRVGIDVVVGGKVIRATQRFTSIEACTSGYREVLGRAIGEARFAGRPAYVSVS